MYDMETKMLLKHYLEQGVSKAESGLDRTHVDALADPHQVARPRKPRQRLIDGRAIARVKQRSRTKRCGLGERGGKPHDAMGKAAHVPTSNSVCQKSNGKSTLLQPLNMVPRVFQLVRRD